MTVVSLTKHLEWCAGNYYGGAWCYENDVGSLRNIDSYERLGAYTLGHELSIASGFCDDNPDHAKHLATDLVDAYVAVLVDNQRYQALDNFFEGSRVRHKYLPLLLAPLKGTSTCKHKLHYRTKYFNRLAGELIRREREDVYDILKDLV